MSYIVEDCYVNPADIPWVQERAANQLAKDNLESMGDYGNSLFNNVFDPIEELIEFTKQGEKRPAKFQKQPLSTRKKRPKQTHQPTFNIGTGKPDPKPKKKKKMSSLKRAADKLDDYYSPFKEGMEKILQITDGVEEGPPRKRYGTERPVREDNGNWDQTMNPDNDLKMANPVDPTTLSGPKLARYLKETGGLRTPDWNGNRGGSRKSRTTTAKTRRTATKHKCSCTTKRTARRAPTRTYRKSTYRRAPTKRYTRKRTYKRKTYRRKTSYRRKPYRRTNNKRKRTYRRCPPCYTRKTYRRRPGYVHAVCTRWKKTYGHKAPMKKCIKDLKLIITHNHTDFRNPSDPVPIFKAV